MSNVEARRNVEIRMAKQFRIASSSFDHSSLFRHSSFVIWETLNFPNKKRIVFLLFAHARYWSVTGTNDRLVGQCQNFLEVILHGVFVGHAPAAHRAGKKRVAHDGDRSGKPVHNESHSAGRMAP